MTQPPTQPKSRRPRRLSDEEIALWLSVAARVKPRRGSSLPKPTQATIEPLPTPANEVPSPPPAPSARRNTSALPPLAPIERKLRQRLARRRATVEATLDLHGLRQDEAERALRRFLIGAQAEGFKIVAVITGKGRRGSDGEFEWHETPGVLRRKVPVWLGMPDYRPLIVGFEEAGAGQGGAGALFVRVRRHPGRERFASR